MNAPNVLSDADLSILPIERAQTIPASWYTDPDLYAAEVERLVGETWQGIGHVGQVREPGQHFVATVADNPVIVVRGDDGELRAFYNVCRHRGGPLATEDGCTKMLQCRYHGWTYRLDGSLRGVPKFDRVELFDKRDYGLVPIRVETWEGLVFVNLTDGGPAPAESMAGIAERIDPTRLADMRFVKRVDYEVACNWKVYIDNFLEGYHIPFVHPELCKLYDYQRYTTEVHDAYSLQWSPLRDEDNPYGGGGTAFYYFVFPNFMINILPGRLQTNLVVPTGLERTTVIFWYFYADVDSEAARRRIAADMEFSDKVQREDMEICEHVQRGLGSRAYERGRFSVDQEEAVYDFQRRLRQRVRSWHDGGRI